MNKNTALIDLMVRRRRNRMIKHIIIVTTFALLIGGMVVYSQQRSFSLMPGNLNNENSTRKPPRQCPIDNNQLKKRSLDRQRIINIGTRYHRIGKISDHHLQVSAVIDRGCLPQRVIRRIGIH